MDLRRRGRTSAPAQRVVRTLGPVKAPPLVQRHPALRWLAPIAVVGIAGLAATGVFRAQASSDDTELPQMTPGALISAVQTPRATGFSGTVVSRFSLGLPELPMLSGNDSGGSATSMVSLLSGSHTLQVWYGGPAQQRVALLGATDETDLFRSGRQLWRWTSSDRVAVHAVLPARSRTGYGPLSSPTASPSVTPADLTRDLLRDLDPTTRVTMSDERQVANRAAYELELEPRSDQTRIGSIRIAIDGRTKVPLGVQVYARGDDSPAVDVSYTSIRFERPPATFFTFTPPSGATVRRADLADLAGRVPGLHDGSAIRQHGSGWTTVTSYRLRGAHDPLQAIDRSSFRDAFHLVQGPWGVGRLATCELASVLVTDDGRVFAGSVEPDLLFAAAR